MLCSLEYIHTQRQRKRERKRERGREGEREFNTVTFTGKVGHLSSALPFPVDWLLGRHVGCTPYIELPLETLGTDFDLREN